MSKSGSASGTVGSRPVALLLACLLVLAASCSSPRESPPTDTPRLVGQIIFTRTSGRDVQTDFIADADGSDERQLTMRGEYCCMLRISPDHSGILVMPGELVPSHRVHE